MDQLRVALRSFATVVKLGFDAAPMRVSAAIAAQLMLTVFSLTSNYAIKFVVQEALARQVSGALWAAAALALAAGGSAVAFLAYASLLPKMFELVTLKVDSELIRLANSIPTLDHHDRPAFADKLALARQGRHDPSPARSRSSA